MELNKNQILQQAITAHSEGKLEGAERLYREILKDEPTHLDANNNLGVLLQTSNRLEEAEKCYKKAIEFKPDFAEGHYNLAITSQRLNKLDEAEISLRKTIQFKADFVQAYSSLGFLLSKKSFSKLEEVEKNFKKAIQIKPDFFVSYNGLANAYMAFGRLEEAEKNYNKALDINPNYVDAHFNLCHLKKFNKEDKQFDQMQKLHLDQNLTDEDRCKLSFALAWACEGLNKISESFRYYSEGNALQKKSHNYNINRDIELFGKLKKTYPDIEKNSLKNSNLSNEPKIIFILGMHRSGTTLIEQIISSHSKVIAGGELSYIEELGRDIASGLLKIDEKIILDFREKYLKKIQKLSDKKSIITDKMPSNFRNIALICSAFPSAKIIHVKRDPKATCWGNYKKCFKKGVNQYSNYFDDLVTYFKLYENLMQFWQEKYADRIYNLDYESLTIDQEEETRKLIEHLQIEWEEECLAPQNNKRIVHTTSRVQVMQKIYKDSSKEWQKFEKFLNGAFNQFDN